MTSAGKLLTAITDSIVAAMDALTEQITARSAWNSGLREKDLKWLKAAGPLRRATDVIGDRELRWWFEERGITALEAAQATDMAYSQGCSWQFAAGEVLSERRIVIGHF